MKFQYLLMLLLAGCCSDATVVEYHPEIAITVVPAPPPHKYDVGQCFVVFDPETGKSNDRDIVRIEQIAPTYYVYRWHTYQNEWALDTNTGIGRFDLFESMTKETQCPK